MGRRDQGLLVLLLAASTLTKLLTAQDGASFNPKAKEYRAPAGSMVVAPESPALDRALSQLFQGDVASAVPALMELAEAGDVGSALLLGSFLRKASNFPIPVDPVLALRFYQLASSAGSGEGSERIAEMIERQEVPAPREGDTEYWRGLAVKQGWQEQRLATYCFDWKHGPEPLHCEIEPIPSLGETSLEVPPPCPSEDEMRRMREQGVSGAIKVNGGSTRLDPGPHAKAILLFDHAVPSEEDLQEPDAGTVVYVQTPTDHWRMLPPEAPLLSRFLILTPHAGAGRMSMSAQAVDGSQTGGACSSFTN